MSLKAYYQNIRHFLEQFYVPTEAQQMAFLLLESEGFSRKDLILDSQKIPDTVRMDNYLQRLAQFEPIQYILGKTFFYENEFLVTPDVLIPRVETEELVGKIVREKLPAENILDICTGSGCIAISLAQKFSARLLAWDISEAALEVAQKNAQNIGVNVLFEKKDILQTQAPNRIFDIIVSNPPYVTLSQKAQMQPNVLRYEPHLALFVADEKALIFYEAIANFALQNLRQNGKIYFEINEVYGKACQELLQNKGFRQVHLYKDLREKDRFVTALAP